MREIKIKVYRNKKMAYCGDVLSCRKGENKIDVIKFTVSDELLQFNNFLILKSPKGTKYIDILGEELTYSIGSYITNEVGTWTIQFLSTSQEDVIVEDDIDDTQVVMLSDVLSFTVIDSLFSETLEIPPTSTNLDFFFEEFTNLYNTLRVLIEDYPNIEDYNEVQEELKKLQEMIENITMEVEVDNTEVLIALDELTKIVQGMTVEVDFTPVLNVLATMTQLIETIPTLDYTNELNAIKDDINKIPTTTYTNELNAINKNISAIPTIDYSNELNAIKEDIKAIPTIDYTSELDAIMDEISAISVDVDLTPVLTKLEELKTLTSKIPTLTYTNELKEIKDGVNAIPTLDYSNDLNTIKGDIKTIPTITYTDTLTSIIMGIDEVKESIGALSIEVDLTPVLTKLDTIESELGTIKENIATMLQMVGVTYNNVVDVKNQLESNQANFNRIQGIETSTQSIDTITQNINTKLGDYDGTTPPANNTIWHDAYWALVRAEQANSNAEDIRDLKGGKLTEEVASMQTKLDEIYEKVKTGGGGDYNDPTPYLTQFNFAPNDASLKYALDLSNVKRNEYNNLAVTFDGCTCDTLEIIGSNDDIGNSGMFTNSTINVLNLNNHSSKCTITGDMFKGAKIKEILNLNLDYAESGDLFYSWEINDTLTRLTFSGSFSGYTTNEYNTLILHNCTALTSAAIEEMGKSLKENTSGFNRYITIEEGVFNELTDEQKLIFTDKGYGLTSVANQ